MGSIGPTEFILLILIVILVFPISWSFWYVVKKARGILQMNPEALRIWQAVALHILCIVAAGALAFFLLPEPVQDFFAWLGLVIMPVYLNRKSRALKLN